MSCSMIIALIFSIILVIRFNVKLQRSTLNDLLTLIRDGWGYFYSRLTMILFSKFNIIIIAVSLGEASAGYFSLAERIYNAGRSVVSPLTDALYPHMVKTKNWSLTLKIIKLAIIAAIGILGLTYMTADWFFVQLFGSEEYQQSAEIFKILMFAFSFSLISMLIGYPVLGAMGQAKYVNRSVLVGACAHLLFIAALWLMNILSSEMLAVSLVSTELIILLFRLFYLKRNNVFLTKSKQPLTNGGC